MRLTDTCELRELPCEGYQIISLNTCGISQRASQTTPRCCLTSWVRTVWSQALTVLR